MEFHIFLIGKSLALTLITRYKKQLSKYCNKHKITRYNKQSGTHPNRKFYRITQRGNFTQTGITYMSNAVPKIDNASLLWSMAGTSHITCLGNFYNCCFAVITRLGNSTLIILFITSEAPISTPCAL